MPPLGDTVLSCPDRPEAYTPGKPGSPQFGSRYLPAPSALFALPRLQLVQLGEPEWDTNLQPVHVLDPLLVCELLRDDLLR